MSTLLEFEAAADALPWAEKHELLRFLAARLQPAELSRGLKAASRPGLEGLPPDLSINTREKVAAAVTRAHAADR